MSDRRGLAVRLVALSVLKKRVTAEEAKVKAALAEELTAGERTVAALDDQTVVGGVTYTKGRASARVTDDRALLAWVQANHPDELVQTVRGSFVNLLLEDAKKNGIAADRTTGEIVPGVTVTFGEPYLSVRPDPANEAALIEAIRANRLIALDGIGSNE